MNKDTTSTIIIFIGFLLISGISLAFAYVLSNSNLSTTDSDASGTTLPIVTPEEIVVSNLSSSSATISWYTSTDATGYVQFGTTADSKTSVSRDFRDTGASTSRKLHYIQLTGLRENTKYFIDIYSNGNIVENAAVTDIQTFATSDELATPETVLIDAGTDFSTGGLFYAHFKNGADISTTVSTLSTSERIALTMSNAKKQSSGENFDADDAFILVSATNETGTRAREIFAFDKDSNDIIALETGSSTTPIYASGESFVVPTGIIASDPEPVVNPTPVVNQPTTPTPVQTPTPSVGGVTSETPLPKTAIEPDLILDVLGQAGALGLVALGFSLIIKR